MHTCLRQICAGSSTSFTAAENVNPTLTATPAGTPSISTSSGVVMVPAPTPVSAMKTAMMNPIRYSTFHLMPYYRAASM